MGNKTLLMGNELAALGAVRAGVTVATGYPGTPSTEALEYLAKHYGKAIHVEWSVNEKSALEVAAGASYAGARTFVTMKQVGLNVASDPIMSLRYVGLQGGMVVYVADDPGPISSQTEQDTRTFAAFGKFPVFDPSSPEEAFAMMEDAYALSERLGTPVIMRPTTRVCHANAAFDANIEVSARAADGFRAGGQRIIFPRTSYLAHLRIEDECEALSDEFSHSKWNTIVPAEGRLGIAASGVSYAYAMEALEILGVRVPVLKIGNAFPFPEALAKDFLSQVDSALVFEELDPVVERGLIYTCGKYHLPADILGKGTRHMPRAGENSVEIILAALRKYLCLPHADDSALPMPPELPARPPVLCAGCPHRASFYAVKRAVRRLGVKALFGGDIGCYTLGNAKPLEMVDTCLCMGAGITVAQGVRAVEPDTVAFSFTGDSTFFHTGLAGIANAVYNGASMFCVILDNSTTAMTGQQPNPSTGFRADGEVAQKISIEGALRGLGVEDIQIVNPFDQRAAQDAVAAAARAQGVRAVIFRAPCIAVSKPKTALRVDPNLCTGCRACARMLGCPAIVANGIDRRVKIEAGICTGCGLCSQVCPAGAIGGISSCK